MPEASMIHIAPCSCELHVKIRELEAELAAQAKAYAREYHRAEMAEARLAELERMEDDADA
jgi:hypothetical protein